MQNLPAFFPAVGLEERFEHDIHRAAVARITGGDPARELGPGEVFPALHQRQTGELLHPQILENAEARNRRAIPAVTGIEKLNARYLGRNRIQNVRRRDVCFSETVVRQKKERLQAAAEEQVDADAPGLAGKFGLDKAQARRGAPHLPPFNHGRLLELVFVPRGKPLSELLADGFVVRRDDHDARGLGSGADAGCRCQQRHAEVDHAHRVGQLGLGGSREIVQVRPPAPSRTWSGSWDAYSE